MTPIPRWMEFMLSKEDGQTGELKLLPIAAVPGLGCGAGDSSVLAQARQVPNTELRAQSQAHSSIPAITRFTYEIITQ